MKIALSLTLALIFVFAGPAAADVAEEQAAAEAEYHRMLEDAERVRMEAETARREARRIGEAARETAREQARMAREQADSRRAETEDMLQERERREEELRAARDELSRAHREMREASREIAEAHRELARAAGQHREVRFINLGERPVIGVVLGEQHDEGVLITGVSPDGPADKAGVKSGDVLVSLAGENLAKSMGAGREVIFRIMDEAEPGEELALTVQRGDEIWDFTVTPERREPRSWQSIVRIPELSAMPVAPGVENIHIERIERIEIPEIDEEEIARQVAELSKELENRSFRFIGSDGEDLEFDEIIDMEYEGFSDLAEHAMHEANIWFGLPRAQGLELASIDSDLGKYFKTDRGVLVIKAREDNDYQLQSGDVILQIDSREVNSPTDVVRALREVEAGQKIDIEIKRERRTVTLKPTMPENRFGLR